MAAEKKYSVIITRRGKERVEEGTLAELIEYFGYKLETGKSYEREKGNSKINTKPRTFASLITNLNNAENNAAANGCGQNTYR